MAIKFSQFNLRTDHTSGMYLVGYDGNQNIHITVDNLFDDFINGTENTIAMFGTNGLVLADSMLSQNANATLLTVAGQLNVDSAATFDTSITVSHDSTLNGNVTLGNASTDLITQNGTLYLNGPVKDTTDTLGAVDQVLLSDATGELTFTDLADLHVGGAEVVEVPVKNVQGSALVKGDPVYISGSVGASGRLEVQLADASNTLKMPAVGLLKQNLADQAEGFAVVTGKLRNLITDPIDGVNPTENDVIYVKPSGTSGAALTTTKPVYGNFIQNIGKVGRVSTAADGNLVVSSILRTNDIPNLTPGRLWVGSTGNTIESQTLFVDEANGRLGVGTASPAEKLHVVGNIQINDHDGTGNLQIGATDGAGNDAIIGMAARNSSNGISPKVELRTIYDSSGGTNGSAFTISTRSGSGLNEKMRIDSAGNVGIGTNSPSTKLEVAGTVGNFQTTGHQIFLTRNGNNEIYAVGASSVLALGTNSAEKMRIDSSGNVGIGTTSPTYKLHINGGTLNTLANFQSTDAGAFISFSDNTTTSGEYAQIGAVGNTVNIRSGNATTATFDSSGNVGIGTTAPAKKLHVEGEARINNNGGNVQFVGTDHVYLGFYPRTMSSGRKAYLGYAAHSTTDFTIMNEDNGAFIIGTNNSEKLRILSTGNVGIGTTSPSAKLDVNGEVRFNTNTGTTPFYVTRLGNIGESLKISVLDQDAIFESIQDESLDNYGGFQFRLDSGTTEPDFQIRKGSDPALFLVNGGGNVGIGTTSPAAALNIVKSGLAAQLRISTTEADSTIKYGAIVGSHYTNSEEPIAGILMTSSSSSTGGSVSIGGGISAANAVNNIIFYTATNSTTLTGSERMRIDSSGDVSIGTTSPSVIGGTAKMTIDVGGGSLKPVSIVNGTTDGMYIRRYTTGGSYQLQTTVGSANAGNLSLQSYAGNVGIGTTSPASKLDVNGGIRMADDSSTASASNVGTLRYRTSGNNSYVDMCMQTGASTYAWVNIVQNNW